MALTSKRAVFIVARESPKEVPAGATRSEQHADAADEESGCHTPDVTNAVVERITVELPDGFNVGITVTLPQGYQKGTRLPAIFWLDPREFQDQDGVIGRIARSEEEEA